MLHNIRCTSYELLKKGWVVLAWYLCQRGSSGSGCWPTFLWFLDRKAALTLTSRKKLYNVRCNSQWLLKKGWVVFRVISLLERQFWQWASAHFFYGLSIEKQPKTWPPERRFIMLYMIHNSFWRKAEWFLAFCAYQRGSSGSGCQHAFLGLVN